MIYGYIYKLVFSGTDKVYIGQSKTPNTRLTQHLNRLKNNIAPIKLQEAYNMYGKPSMELLIECYSSNELDAAEKEAVHIYNSVTNGFNSREAANVGGVGACGDKNGNSKYSNSFIIEIMKFILENPKMTLITVSKKYDIPLIVIQEIASGVKHKWLALEYPHEYQILMDLRGKRSKVKSAKDRGIVYPPIYSPDGTEYHVENTREFARQYDLNCSCLGKVLNRKAKTHKGWHL